MTDLLNTGFELFGYFEKTPDLVCIADKAGYFKRVNPAVIEKLGYTEKELFARPIASFIYLDDRDVTHDRRTTLLSGEVLHNFVNRYVKKNGDIIWLEWTSIYFSEKEIVFAIAKDVTERKKMEMEVQEKYKTYKNLATHFKSNLEKDRKYFAYELHEEIAQLAAAVKMDINWIANNANDLPGKLKDRISNAELLSELLIKKIQRIAFSISPQMVNLFNLNDAMQWLSNEFTILNNIPCRYESNLDDRSISREIQIDFFRICQESLNNVTAHANAKNVIIRIEDFDDQIQLSITDDGKGFSSCSQNGSSGLANMKSRAESINSRLTVKSEPGCGTTVTLHIEKSLA